MLEVCFGPGLIEEPLRFLAIGFRLPLHALFRSLFFVKRLELLRLHGTKLRLVFLGLLIRRLSASVIDNEQPYLPSKCP